MDLHKLLALYVKNSQINSCQENKVQMKKIITTYNTLEQVSQKNEIFTQWNFASAKQLNMEMCSQTVSKLIELKNLILNLRKSKPR